MELRRRGYDVPGRIAVAGFGDFEVSRWCSPRITTVTLDAYGLGRQAGQVVLDALQARQRGEQPAPAQHWPVAFAIDARKRWASRSLPAHGPEHGRASQYSGERPVERARLQPLADRDVGNVLQRLQLEPF